MVPEGYRRWATGYALLIVPVLAAGCQHTQTPGTRAVAPTTPVVPPPAVSRTANAPVIAPAAVVRVEAVQVVPRPPYRLGPDDALYVVGEKPTDDLRLNGVFAVEADGAIDLGPKHAGRLRVADLTIPDAQRAVQERVRQTVRDAEVVVALARSRGVLAIEGRHPVHTDGTVSLGEYGRVRVAGLTAAGAKQAIEMHLAQYLDKPEVTVEVSPEAGKDYYVLTDPGGNGWRVVRVPHAETATVLDAAAHAGVTAASSVKAWVARPLPGGADGDQILPVDWAEIARRGLTRTNYQILPGDRVYFLDLPVVAVAAPVGSGGATCPSAGCSGFFRALRRKWFGTCPPPTPNPTPTPTPSTMEGPNPKDTVSPRPSHIPPASDDPPRRPPATLPGPRGTDPNLFRRIPIIPEHGGEY